VVLSALALAFAQAMRTEALSSANRASYVQADSVERAAEMWVLAQTESYSGDALTITQTPAEAIQVGGGYFWILSQSQVNDQTYQAGITDESGKLNLNVATETQLLNLPNMTQPVADSILNWAGGAGSPYGDGAQTDYYQMLDEPYDAKNSPLETVEELNLVEGVDSTLMFGSDLNRNGVVDDAERATAANNNSLTLLSSASSAVNSVSNLGADDRGIFNDVTVYSAQPNTAPGGAARTNVNTATTTALQTVLTKQLGSSVANSVMSKILPLRTAAKGGNAFGSIGAFWVASGLTAQQFGQVFDYLTTNPAKTLNGLINVNTAPEAVLECLPGLTQSDADTLISARANASTSAGIAWVLNTLTKSKAIGILGSITAHSYQYSADIVAVGGDGRSFKRVRIVVDSRSLPATIVYRRDLSSYGWPLAPGIREAMRAGQPPPTGIYAVPGNNLQGLGQQS
jgi:type II secretory pathway component PulK